MIWCRAIGNTLALALATALSARDMPSGALGAGTVGFLGVGTINSAVCRGLCTLAPELRPSEVLLSPRGAAKAAALAADFPGVCRVCETNQAVVDGSDTLFLAMLPQQADACRALAPARAARHLAARGHEPLARVRPRRARAADRVARGAAAAREGPPRRDRRTRPTRPAAGARARGAIFDRLGTAVPCASEEEMATLQVGARRRARARDRARALAPVAPRRVTRTSTRARRAGRSPSHQVGAAHGQLLRAAAPMTGWMAKRGVARRSRRYVGRLMHSVAGDAADAGGAGVGALIAEQTPGGFNEQAIREMTVAGVFD